MTIIVTLLSLFIGAPASADTANTIRYRQGLNGPRIARIVERYKNSSESIAIRDGIVSTVDFTDLPAPQVPARSFCARLLSYFKSEGRSQKFEFHYDNMWGRLFLSMSQNLDMTYSLSIIVDHLSAVESGSAVTDGHRPKQTSLALVHFLAGLDQALVAITNREPKLSEIRINYVTVNSRLRDVLSELGFQQVAFYDDAMSAGGTAASRGRSYRMTHAARWQLATENNLLN